MNTNYTVPEGWDYMEFTIGSHWPCAMEYGPDETDLSAEEVEYLDAFLAGLPANGHWTWGEENFFAIDEVTNMGADCIEAQYQWKTEEEKLP